MKSNVKRIVAAACIAAFLAASFIPCVSEAANGRMSLAQAQQQIKQPLYRHYKPRQNHVLKHKNKHSVCSPGINTTPLSENKTTRMTLRFGD